MIEKRPAFARMFSVVIIFALVFVVSQFILPDYVHANSYSKAEPGSKKAVSTIKKIKAAGKIVVGTSTDYPPYEFHLLNDPEGELVGIDIDIARVIADELGVKLEIKDLIFSDIFKALKSGKIDIAIAGLHPTEKRSEIADFSEVYYQAIQNILIKTENAEKIKVVEDFRGKKVGTQKDSIQDDMARTYIHGAEFVVRPTIEELIIILRKGLVHAVVLEKPVADYYVNTSKMFMSIKCKSFDNLLGSAVAVKKGNRGLLKEINRILAKLEKEDKIKEFVENAKMLVDRR